MDAPTDDLVRYVAPEQTAARYEDRAADDTESPYIGTLSGHFAVFDRWTEIDSVLEGRFRERIAPGAFAKTFQEQRGNLRVLWDHGQDAQLGNKPLGPIQKLEEDRAGAYYEVGLIDTAYNRDFIVPAGREPGLLGSSFRFRVPKGGDDWNDFPKRSQDNPEGLPERTIRAVALREFGPVGFPAYAEATASVRSGSDFFLRSLLEDPQVLARLQQFLATSSTGAAIGTPAAPDAGRSDSTEPRGAALGLTPDTRAAFLRSLDL